MKYEPVIGLEVHAQLATKTKLFCGCTIEFGRTPNSQVCEVCLGMPGVLPVLNRTAVDLAIRAGLALECELRPVSQWSRKNYFYPDLPKGYQISQYDRPYAEHGKLQVAVDGEVRTIGITRIHMEEDAGKSVHDTALAGDRSYVDFNRGGTPLVEIVSEPEIKSAVEAAQYMRTMRQLLRYIGVCDGNMEQGSLRCDANVSIRPVGKTKLGTRTELKNINSFRFVQQAIEYEIYRQTELLNNGGEVVQETRLWDTEAKKTRSMRSKEEAHDYRYFPDPDLPSLNLGTEHIAEIKSAMPELPAARHHRYVQEHGLSDSDAGLLVEDLPTASFFEEALARHANPKSIANWIVNEVLRELKDGGVDELPFGGEHVGELIALIDDNTISGKIAKDVFKDMLQTGDAPGAIVDKKGLKQLTDTSAIEPIVDQILADNAKSVESYKAGNQKLLGFFVGQVMKATQGKANPKMVNEILKKKLA